MSYPRPITVFPGIVQRSPNFVDLQVHDRAEVAITRLWGSPTLNDAYGSPATSGLTGSGGTIFAEAQKGTSFVSRTLQRTQLVEESRRGMTRYYFNPDDFVVPVVPPASLMPPDDAILFARLQEYHYSFGGWLQVPASATLNKGDPILGPIRVIPTAEFWAERTPALTLAGLAPASTLSVVGSPAPFDETLQVPPPMVITLPRPAKTVTISNKEVAGVDLLFAAGFGSSMVLLDTVNEDNAILEGGVQTIILAAATTVCRFSIYAVFEMEPG